MKVETMVPSDNLLPPVLSSKDPAALLRFYLDVLGFDERDSMVLTFEQKPVLRLQPSTGDEAHHEVRVHLPDRRQLAKVVGRLCTVKYPNTRSEFADKEAIDLRDPDGNAVQFFTTKVSSGNLEERPLDIEKLFNELLPDDRLCDKIPASAVLTIEVK